MTTSLSPKKRLHPLSAASEEDDGIEPILRLDAVPVDAATLAERDDRFANGVRTLRVGGASLQLEERILMVLGGVIAPLGLVVVLLGWWGAAHSPYVFEQLPYLISGGLLGVGMIFLGAFLYFTHWLTQLVKEHRIQSVAVLEALQRLQDQVARRSDGEPTGSAARNGPTQDGSAVLVATARGTMAHRQDCVVVADKTGLRHVSEADGLAACKLCSP